MQPHVPGMSAQWLDQQDQRQEQRHDQQHCNQEEAAFTARGGTTMTVTATFEAHCCPRILPRIDRLVLQHVWRCRQPSNEPVDTTHSYRQPISRMPSCDRGGIQAKIEPVLTGAQAGSPYVRRYLSI